MPYSSGTYSLPSGNPVVTGTTISSSTTNTTNSDIATALSTCVLKDGTQTITANLPMASHKLTGLSAGTTAGDSVEYGGSPSFTNLAYTGTLTGSTGILNIGSGQVYKDAAGKVGFGTAAPASPVHIVSAKATNQDAAAIGQLLVCDSSAYNASPIAGIQFGVKYNTSGDIAHGCTIQNNKENSTNGDFSQALVFTTQLTGNSPAERLRITSGGELCLNRTSSFGAEKASFSHSNDVLSLNTSGASGFPLVCRADYVSSNGNMAAFVVSGNVVGSIVSTGSVTAYNVTSDKRLKTNIVDAPSALDSINAIQVRSFDWISDNSHQDYGYIAQELLEVAPEAVTVPTDKAQMLGVDFSKLTPRIVKALQEQQALIEALTARLTALEAK